MMRGTRSAGCVRRATILASCAVLFALGTGRATEREGNLYVDVGEGLHANDARVAVLRKDEDFDPLSGAAGHELGARTHPSNHLELATAVWVIDLDDELEPSDDGRTVAGSFAPAGPAHRWGVDVEARYQVTRWLTADYDLAWADPHRGRGSAIPLAPGLLMTGGLLVEPLPRLSLTLRARYVDDRPGSEEGSFAGRSYFLLDVAGEYRWRNVEASIQLLNLASANRPETPVASRDEISFTSRGPFGLIAGLDIHF